MLNENVGRPLKLTSEVKNKILESLKKGATYELACCYAGIAGMYCFICYIKKTASIW